MFKEFVSEKTVESLMALYLEFFRQSLEVLKPELLGKRTEKEFAEIEQAFLEVLVEVEDENQGQLLSGDPSMLFSMFMMPFVNTKDVLNMIIKKMEDKEAVQDVN